MRDQGSTGVLARERRGNIFVLSQEFGISTTYSALQDGDKMTPPSYTTGFYPSTPKEFNMQAITGKRLTTRITDHVQSTLQAAADLVGATLNQFVVQAALEKAEKVIESESMMVLSRNESLRLLELIENPPPRNEKFLQAQARYQRTMNDASSKAH
jgi:uncharacterized protein (DUF1778 family)